jgi:hypothetical protein
MAPHIELLVWVSRCSHCSVGKAPPTEVFVGSNVGGAIEVYGPSLPLEEAQLVARVVLCEIQPHQGVTCK